VFINNIAIIYFSDEKVIASLVLALLSISVSHAQVVARDPLAVINQYKTAGGYQPPTQGTQPDLLIFVSSSMPKNDLKEYSKQAKVVGATIVLRGDIGESRQKTQQFVGEVDEVNANWQINPPLFKTFRVQTVPTFVLATASAGFSLTEDGCAKADSYISVKGDQSLPAALDRMRRSQEGELAKFADALWRQY